MTTTTQTQQILAWLKGGKDITALSALKRFRCLRLSGRIYDLRKQGHRIKSEPVKVGDKRVSRYRLA